MKTYIHKTKKIKSTRLSTVQRTTFKKRKQIKGWVKKLIPKQISSCMLNITFFFHKLFSIIIPPDLTVWNLAVLPATIKTDGTPWGF